MQRSHAVSCGDPAFKRLFRFPFAGQRRIIEAEVKNMTEKELLRLAREAGIDHAAVTEASELVFVHDFRKYCEMNQCGNYGRNYGCPPDCGTPREMEEKAMAYGHALVLQTLWPVEDITDSGETGPLKKKHNQKLRAFMDQLAAKGVPGLAIMAGPCSLCSPCAKTSGLPCRFPERTASCLSAYGIDVARLCERTGLSWDFGSGKVAFFGIYMYD